MKPRKISLCLLTLAMTMAMSTSAFAASPDEPLLGGILHQAIAQVGMVQDDEVHSGGKRHSTMSR